MSRYQFMVLNKSQRWGQSEMPDLCATECGVTKIIQAIINLESLPFLETKPDIFRPEIIGKNVGHFFSTKIKKVLFENDEHSATCREGEGKVMHVCPCSSKLSLLQNIYMLIHKARHIDGFFHVKCSRGELKDFDDQKFYGSCDDSYVYQGSYGVAVNFLVEVSRNLEVEPEMHQQSRAQALVDLFERFNKLPFEIREENIFVGQDKRLTFFDGEKSTCFHSRIAS